MPFVVFAQEDSLSQQVKNFGLNTQTSYTNEELATYQYVQRLLQDVIEQYRKGNYKKALNASKSAQNALEQLPNRKDLVPIFSSIDNIIKVKNLEGKKTTSNKQPKKLKWEADEISTTDQSRYLFALWINPNFEIFNLNGRKDIYRAGIETSIEFFLPYLERSIGFSGSFTAGFLDFNLAKVVDTYTIYQYSAFFQYRLAWNLPAIDQTATLTIKAGAIGQFVTEKRINSYPFQSLKSYIVPAIELGVQDPILNRIFQNKFNKNLIFNPSVAFHYLPGTQDDAIGFSAALGIYYRFNEFLIGPKYTFQLYYNTKKNINQTLSRIALVMSTQF
ncbi:MAG: hypothetical protein ACRCVN_04030 [Spirochaetia bacterium]